MKIFKKLSVLFCCLITIVLIIGCSSKTNQDNQNAPSQPQSEAPQSETTEEIPGASNSAGDIGIENGGDIDDSGNVSHPIPSDAAESESKPNAPIAETPEPIKLQHDENGNITKDSAIMLLQKYSAQQLGLSVNVRHQLLFDENAAEVNQKKCYAIVAKLEGGETEGIFYVSYDGKDVYKYDLENQKYVRLP